MLKLSIQELLDLSVSILEKHGASKSNAVSVANSLIAAQINGQVGHGLIRLLTYTVGLQSGKIEGQVEPEIHPITPSLARIDAKFGFAYPALDLAVNHIIKSVESTGVSLVTIYHSHHCGMLGFYVNKLAAAGYVSLMFANSPQAIAPWGGSKGVFGTNPIAFGAPRKNSPPIIVDMSLSKVARGKILFKSKTDNIIEEGLALDRNGNPTTNASEALAGVLLPIGNEKGSALCLMVEILSACISGSNIGCEASSFFDDKGGYPNVGQSILAFNQKLLSGGQYEKRVEDLCGYILEQKTTRIPGDNKVQFEEMSLNEKIAIEDNLYQDLKNLL